MGLISKKLKLADGEFGSKGFISFNVCQIICHVLAWGVVAPVLDILIYAEPANKVFVQGLVGGASNIVTTAIIGSILCAAYAGSRPKSGSLSKDN